MSQEYTPVTWQDETTSTQGTLINAERLNAMQEAHHYADGFEEVDAVPTADPGVDYHKIVYCTADSTFYRWDGSAWAADIDDDTKALLQQEITRATERENEIAGDLATETTNRTNADTALGTRITNEATARGNADDAINLAVSSHVGDHSNPHEVTKAQVGLGNCDNTSDADKPVSTAVQSALDTKASASDLTTLAGRVTGTEGSITTLQGKVSTLESADTQNVKLTGAQTIPGAKTFSSAITAAAGLVGNVTGSLIGNADTATRATTAASADHADAATTADSATSADKAIKLGTVDVGTDTKPIKLVGGTATAVANDLVDTATAQTIGGNKTLTGATTLSSTLAVSGAVTMASTLAVTGTTTHSNTVVYEGDNIVPFAITCTNTNMNADRTQYGAGHSETNYAINSPAGQSLGVFGLDDGTTYRQLKMSLFAPGGAGWTSMMLRSDTTAGIYLSAPTPTSAAPTTAVPTIAWTADTNGLNNLVHRNGVEIINGEKILTSNLTVNAQFPRYIFKMSDVDVNNLPATTLDDRGNIRWLDKNGTQVAALRFNFSTTGAASLQLIVRNADGTNKYVTLGQGDSA